MLAYLDLPDLLSTTHQPEAEMMKKILWEPSQTAFACGKETVLNPVFQIQCLHRSPGHIHIHASSTRSKDTAAHNFSLTLSAHFQNREIQLPLSFS